jgi:murein DD-endopeptidase MepM/ murein hydrolase activator NlpD
MFRSSLLFGIAILSACVPHRIPLEEATPFYPLRKGKYYQAKEGDTLWKISKMYNISIERLMTENNISSPQDLKVGQKLFIPQEYLLEKKITSFAWPLKGEIVNFFGENINNVINKGINIKVDLEGEVKAAEDGVVIFSNYLKGWGKTVVIKHPEYFYTIYAHLKEVFFKEGEYVKRGEVIGKVGQDVSGNFILHFEIRKHFLAENPLRYLSE